MGELYEYDAYWDGGGLVFLDIPLSVSPRRNGEKTIIAADAILRTYLGRLKGNGQELSVPKRRKFQPWHISFPVNPDNIRPLQDHESYPEDPHAEYAGDPYYES